MICFVLTNDLMFQSQVAGAAAAAGLDCKQVGRPELIDTNEQHIVVVDLTMPGWNADALEASSLRKRIAVGPHVHEAKLTAASEAGYDHVITKGQVSRELGELLRRSNG